MTERFLIGTDSEITKEQQLKVAQFTAQHLHTPLELRETYHEETIKRWIESVGSGNRQPFWLRRIFANTNEFSAVVDYCILDGKSNLKTFAALDIERDISVLLPDEDGIPVSVARFPYDEIGLAMAVEHVEGMITHN